jgi:hypothetical protein
MFHFEFGRLSPRTQGRLKFRLLQAFLVFCALAVVFLDTASFKVPMEAFWGKTVTPAAASGQPQANLIPWKQKDYAAINRLFDNLDTAFPKDLIKAIAWCESEWNQVDENGRLFVTVNRQHAAGRSRNPRITLDYGVMQINERMESLDPKAWDWELIKNDPEYNLRAGVAVLESKFEYIRTLKHRPNWKQLQARYHLQGHDDLDLALKAYNGFQPSWAYPRRIREALRDKPWEKAVLRQFSQESNRPGEALLTLAPVSENEGVGWSRESVRTAQAGLAGTEAFWYTLDLNPQ